MKDNISAIVSVWLLFGAIAMTGPVVMACIALVATVIGAIVGLISVASIFSQGNSEN